MENKTIESVNEKNLILDAGTNIQEPKEIRKPLLTVEGSIK